MTASTTEAKVDIDLMIDVLAHIEVYPERYYQGDWANLIDTEIAKQESEPTTCQTAFCVAGWVCAITAKGHPVYSQMGPESDRRWYATSSWILPDGKIVPIALLASELLTGESLDVPATDTWHEVQNMFSADNNLEEVYEGASEITGISTDDLEVRVRARAQEIRDEMARKQAATKGAS